MTLRERIQKLCKINHTSLNQVETELGFGKGYLSKLDNSTPNVKKMGQVANHFGVTIDFLMGKTEQIECSGCGQTYNPFDELDCSIHEQYHDKIIEAQKAYSCLVPYREIASVCAKSLINIKNDKNDRLKSLQEYLKASFSRYVYENFEHGKMFNFDDFCKSEIVKLINDGKIPNDYIDEAISIFQVDSNYINDTDLVLARASKNQQLMRILKYAEMLNPKLLDALEIQTKALAEQSDKE